jgi:hypothetical protein
MKFILADGASDRAFVSFLLFFGPECAAKRSFQFKGCPTMALSRGFFRHKVT